MKKELNPLIEVAVDVANMSTNLIVDWDTIEENSVEILDTNTGEIHKISVGEKTA